MKLEKCEKYLLQMGRKTQSYLTQWVIDGDKS